MHRNSKVYITWTLAALRHARNKTIRGDFHPATRMLKLTAWLSQRGCALQWDTQRRSLIVVPAYPRPYPDNR